MDTIRGKFFKQHLLSDQFLDLIEKNKRPMDELMSYYQCAIMEVETKFKVLNQEYSLEYDRNPIEGIKTRVKSYDSILRKIRRKNIPMTLEGIEENIRDIAGVRVICSFPDDIYELAESFLRQDDITLIERKDYIKNPKESGYRSLHLIVQVPIFLQNTKNTTPSAHHASTMPHSWAISVPPLPGMQYMATMKPDMITAIVPKNLYAGTL